jgi:hypothetical protein
MSDDAPELETKTLPVGYAPAPVPYADQIGYEQQSATPDTDDSADTDAEEATTEEPADEEPAKTRRTGSRTKA